MRQHRQLMVVVIAALAVLGLSAPAANAAHGPSAFAATTPSIPVSDPAPPPGAQVLKYKFGPLKIQPGQNTISIDVQKQRPDVNGWIVGFRPGLVNASDGKSPPVTEVHLHHAVWLVDLKPTFAAGEEKTYFNAPPGFGWRYTTGQSWLINHMIHDLTPTPKEVYITYTLYFIPDTAPQAASITKVDTQWMDVEGGKAYPVFDALRGSGRKGSFTFPDNAKNPYPAGQHLNEWVATHDGTLVGTAGHLHPGGLYTDLDVTRDGRTVRVFRSKANYFEPAGAVSWDVAMGATTSAWKVNVKKGDVLSVHATYDTSKASWYEVMGIMVAQLTDAPVPGGVDPFTGQIDQTNRLTHGRLKENIDIGVRKPNPGLGNPVKLRNGPLMDKVVIKNFTYGQGDLSTSGRKGLPPVITQKQALTFVNEDSPLTIRYHSITACKTPCNLTGGIGYPLAAGPRTFDSGELGYGATISSGLYGAANVGTIPITAAVNTPTDKSNCDGPGVGGLVKVISNGCIGTDTWSTPKNLPVGTYTYFCRIHPFMRGAFRVKKA
ncbi:MAG TPA: hypothetical protein VII98_02655 [Solirubrobacteraceae bacterium]